MSALGLSAEQLAERRKRIHAGDAASIMEGDYRKVFRRLKGLDPDDDLSGEFRVQLGSYTEPFNLFWCQERTGRAIAYYSDNPMMRYIWQGLTLQIAEPHDELRVSEAYPFMAANLDGMSTTPQGHPCVIDAKHVAKFGEAELLRYTPAMVHQATVMDVDWWAISALVGNSKHEVVYQQVDPLYQAQLIARTRECWGYIERDEEPPAPPPVAPPKPQPKRREIILDLTPAEERPNWAQDFTKLARTFADTEGAFRAHAIARKQMDELLPDDVGLCRIGLVTAKRDGRGFSVSLAKPEGSDDRAD